MTAMAGRASLAVSMLALCLILAAVSYAKAEPGRVISLGGDVTEIVYQLGSGDRLAGRDATSTFPPEAKALPDVGYFRQLGAEGVLSLKPDLILATASAGPPEVLQQIASTGVRIEHFADDHSVEGLLRKVRLIAKALNIPEKGEALAKKLDREIVDAKAAVAAMPGRPKVLFVINGGGGTPMAAGRDTAADALIALAGGENVFSSHTGYKPMSLEAAASAAPDAIAMMDHTLKAMGGVAAVADHPAFRLTPAAKHQRIIARDGSYLLSFGPRLPQALIDFARAIRGKGQS